MRFGRFRRRACCCSFAALEGRLAPDDVVLPQHWPLHWEAVLEESIGRVEPQGGGGRWGSEAPSIVGSSYYSTEDEELQVGHPLECSKQVLTFLQGPTLANADDERHVPGVIDSSKVCVKFVLRVGNDWVDQENLSVDPSSSDQVERVAEEQTWKRRFLFNSALRALAPTSI